MPPDYFPCLSCRPPGRQSVVHPELSAGRVACCQSDTDSRTLALHHLPQIGLILRNRLSQVSAGLTAPNMFCRPQDKMRGCCCEECINAPRLVRPLKTGGGYGRVSEYFTKEQLDKLHEVSSGTRLTVSPLLSAKLLQA